MKRFFTAVKSHPAIFVFAATLLILICINHFASLKLERIEKRTQVKQARSRREFLRKVHDSTLVEDYATVALEQSAGVKYFPFVEYIEKARAGKFVNVSTLGTRCHYSDRDACMPQGGAKEIWIFGGSTTFGYGVKDNETIAAYLADKMPDYRIINFGAASYYSTLERIRFENLLTELSPPKAAVFIDGVNDFYYLNVPDDSAYSPTLKAAEQFVNNQAELRSSFSADVRALLRQFPIYRLLQKKFGSSPKTPDHPPAIASHEKILKAITRFCVNHSIVESVGEKIGSIVLIVLQPTPTYGVGHKTSRIPPELLNFGDHENSGLAYKEMLMPNGDLRRQDHHMLNLANLGIDEPMYVDTVHYTPLFNKEISFEIFRKLSELFIDASSKSKGND